MIVWTFFGITFLWDWNEDRTVPVPWPLLNFPNLLTYWVQHFNSIIFWHSDFISFWYIPRSGNAALHCHSTFNFLKKFHTIFHSYCTNLHSHQQWVSLFPTSSPTLILLMSSWQVWGDTSLWCGFAFPSWWMRLSIFSFVCCPSVCFLWKKCLFSSSAQFWKFFFFFFFFFLLLSCSSLCCAAAVLSCPTFYNPMDWSPPGSSVRGIFQARMLEWVAISFSRVSSQHKNWISVSCISCISRQTLQH